jgi:hypothetical protein
MYANELHKMRGKFPWQAGENFQTLPPLHCLIQPPAVDDPWPDNPRYGIWTLWCVLLSVVLS